jgi:L-alanine-DL-glutamate epimerase-like enolase superfamily enzyme
MKLTVDVVNAPYKKPFSITGYTFTGADLVRVTLEEGGARGRGEATGVYYLNDDAEHMCAEIEKARPAIEAGCSREALQNLMPPGGGRNAVDCAMWDLECKRADKTIWELLEIEPKPVTSVYTIGISDAEQMAKDAAEAAEFPLLKIKLDGVEPLARMQAIRAARPDAELVVDANQGWTFDQLVQLAPQFDELNVAMIEQPLPRGNDAPLEEYTPPCHLAADESCLHMGEFDQAAGRYTMINIKLDKCGGLTEALRLVEAARARNLGLMVGNMCGSSLAMAPSFVVAQFCEFVDIDGPLLLQRDIDHGLSYEKGIVRVPRPELWG